MKRRIPAFLLALAMLLGAMTGCGSPKPGVSASEASAASVSQPEPTAAPGPNVPAAVAESVSAVEASETYEKVPVELPFADGESISMFLLIPPFISSS